MHALLVGVIIAMSGVPTSSEAQTTNGPMLGILLDHLDASIDRDYRAMQGDPKGLGGTLGYYVGGSPWRTLGIRAELLMSVRTYKHDFLNSEGEGVFRASVVSVQFPLLGVVSLTRSLRMLGGPMLDLRLSGEYRVEGERANGNTFDFSDSFTGSMRSMGMAFALGMEYRTKGSASFGLRYQKGMSNLMKNDAHFTVSSYELGVVLAFDILGARGWTKPASGS